LYVNLSVDIVKFSLGWIQAPTGGGSKATVLPDLEMEVLESGPGPGDGDKGIGEGKSEEPAVRKQEAKKDKEKEASGDDAVVVILSEHEEEQVEEVVAMQRLSDSQYFLAVPEEEQNYQKKHLLASAALQERSVICTACYKQIDFKQEGAIVRHADLAVPVCMKCQTFYSKSKWTKDEDGYYEHCRWCANGGDLLLCDGCSNVFCKSCIKRNLGRSKVAEIEEAEEWKCLVCCPRQIWKQRALYHSLWTHWAGQARAKEKEVMRKKTREKITFMDETLRDGFDVNKILGNYLQKAQKSWAQKNDADLDEEDVAKLVVKMRTIVKITHHNLELLDRNLVTGCLEAFPGLQQSRLSALAIPDEGAAAENRVNGEQESANKELEDARKKLHAEKELFQLEKEQFAKERLEGAGIPSGNSKLDISKDSNMSKCSNDPPIECAIRSDTEELDIPRDMFEEAQVPEVKKRNHSIVPDGVSLVKDDPAKNNSTKKAALDEANQAARVHVLQSTSSESDQAIIIDEEDPMTPRKKLKTKKELDNIRRMSVAKAIDVLEEDHEAVAVTDTPQKPTHMRTKAPVALSSGTSDSDVERLATPKITPEKKKRPYKPGPSSAKRASKGGVEEKETDSDSDAEVRRVEALERRMLKGSKMRRLRGVAAGLDPSGRQLGQELRVDLPAMGEEIRRQLDNFSEVRRPTSAQHLSDCLLQVNVSEHRELAVNTRKKMPLDSSSSGMSDSVADIDRQAPRAEGGRGPGHPGTHTGQIVLLFPSPWKNEDFCCVAVIGGVGVPCLPHRWTFFTLHLLFQAVQPRLPAAESCGGERA
jgi:hypothetical protein